MTNVTVQAAGRGEQGSTVVVQTAGRQPLTNKQKFELVGGIALVGLGCVSPFLISKVAEQSPVNSGNEIDLKACIFSIDSVKKISANSPGVKETDLTLIAEYNISLAHSLGLTVPDEGTNIQTSVFQHNGANGNGAQGGVEIAISGVPLAGNPELGYSTYVSFKDGGGAIKSFMFNIKDPNDVDVQNIDGNTLVTFQGKSLDPQDKNPANFMTLMMKGTFSPEEVIKLLLEKDFSSLTEFAVGNPLTGVCCVSNLQAGQQNAGTDLLGSAVQLASLDTDAGPVIPMTPIPPTETQIALPTLPAEAQTWVAAHPEFSLSGNLDAGGFHVDFGGGKKIDVPADQIAVRIKVGQEGALQVYSETGDKIIAAYDPETNKWIDRDNVVAKDVFNMETYIHVQTWEQAKEIWRLEKHFMTPFPKGTGFPILNEQQAEYLKAGAVRGTLGNPQPGSEPTKLFNGIILDKGEGREEGDHGIMTEQINNADDTFSAGHFGRTSSRFRDITLNSILFNRNRSYILPIYEESTLNDLQNIKSRYPFIFKLWRDAGLYDGEGLVYKGIKDLVVRWLTTGTFPKELENIILFDHVRNYDFPDSN